MERLYFYCNIVAIKMVNIHHAVQSAGGRVTKIKHAIIDVLSENGCLMNKAEIISALQRKKIAPNRSTLYRELRFLTNNHIVFQNTLFGTEYFEIPNAHHHHLICVTCENIEIVSMKNHLQEEEKCITQQNHFRTLHHSLEFYGYCQKCQT